MIKPNVGLSTKEVYGNYEWDKTDKTDKINNVVKALEQGDIEALKETAYSYLSEKHDLEYLEIYNKNTLEEEMDANDNSIAVIACKVEGVRLIDNIYFSEV